MNVAHRRPLSVRRESALVFVALLSTFILTSSGFDTSEGGYHYQIARQIVTAGTLSLPSGGDGPLIVGPNGRVYGMHEIGNTVPLIPVAIVNQLIERQFASRVSPDKMRYLAGFIVTLVPTVYCAGAAALLYGLLRVVFGKATRAALSGTAVFAFCTFVWTYSRNLFDGVLCMMLLAGTMMALMGYRRSDRRSWFVVGVLLLGCGLITRLSMALVVMAACVYLGVEWRRDRRRFFWEASCGALLLAPFVAWQLYYNALRTGHIVVAPVQLAANNALTGDILVGLGGLLFSPGKSIFVFVPIAVLSIVTFPRFYRRHPAEGLFVGVLVVSWLLLHARLASWYGAWGWGPRHFVTIVPALVLPALVSWESLVSATVERSLLRVAIAWGLVLSASSIVSNWHLRMWLAQLEGRGDAMIWSLQRGQAVDMIVSAADNVRNLVTGVPMTAIPHYSDLNVYASSTVNVWFNPAHRSGVPSSVLVSIAVVLITVAVSSALALRRSARQIAPS
jgi:hypothetical protein